MADQDGNSFLWFLAGLGVGAVVGVLYAPRSGDEMRDVIALQGAGRQRPSAPTGSPGARTGERLGGSRKRCDEPAERAVPLGLRGGSSGV